MPPRPAKHQPTRLNTYYSVHEGYMEQLRSSGFVGADTLRFDWISSVGLFIQGEIACKGLIVVDVEKFLLKVGGEGSESVVQTEMYSYNAFIRGGHNILRYDNQHPETLHQGHPDEHHRHDFDVVTGDELTNIPVWVGAEAWPTLGEAIAVVRDWHGSNYSTLQNPEGFPKLGARG